MTALERTFAQSRGPLMGLAYRMLGSWADAEDVLQDAYLRLQNVDEATVRNAEAYLKTIVTRLSLDHLKSARAKREVYVGPWLPEPIVDAETLSPEGAGELADDLSFALLLTLETLSAPERAAFLLHDVFDTPYAEIAATLEKSEAACRQLAARARRAVKNARPTHTAPVEAHRALLMRFAEAAQTGDASGLEALLAADAVAYSDGGGVKAAALNPIYGADKVVRFFAGLAKKQKAGGQALSVVPATLNGAPGLVVYLDGEFDFTMSIDVADGRIARIYLVRNPEKLGAVEAAVGRDAQSAP